MQALLHVTLLAKHLQSKVPQQHCHVRKQPWLTVAILPPTDRQAIPRASMAAMVKSWSNLQSLRLGQGMCGGRWTVAALMPCWASLRLTQCVVSESATNADIVALASALPDMPEVRNLTLQYTGALDIMLQASAFGTNAFTSLQNP